MIGNSPLAKEFWEHGCSSVCPIYDMHGHMGPYASIYFPRCQPEQLIHTMDQCGVKLLVFSHHMALFSPDLDNRPTIAAVRRFPDRLRGYCVINPNYPDLVEANLASFEVHRDVYVGFKFLSDYHQVPVTDERYRPAWEYADQRGLLLLMHTWGESDYDGAVVVRQALETYPNVRVLLGHCCHGDWDAALDLARDFPNVYLELTALFDDRGILEKFIAGVGSQRMLFGTDLPWFDPHHAIGVLLSAKISDDDRHNICHRNAEKLLAPFIPEKLRTTPSS
jgi:predicted TIM-barrel fold metal-dependent hydrolase